MLGGHHGLEDGDAKRAAPRAGATAARIRKPIAGLQLITSLGQMIDLVEQWCAEYGSY